MLLQEYFARMPWLAIPFEEHTVRQQLSSKFSVMGIPRLVIVAPDGEASFASFVLPGIQGIALICAFLGVQVIANDARSAVMSDRRGEQFPWKGASSGSQGLIG